MGAVLDLAWPDLHRNLVAADPRLPGVRLGGRLDRCRRIPRSSGGYTSSGAGNNAANGASHG